MDHSYKIKIFILLDLVVGLAAYAYSRTKSDRSFDV